MSSFPLLCFLLLEVWQRGMAEQMVNSRLGLLCPRLARNLVDFGHKPFVLRTRYRLSKPRGFSFLFIRILVT